MQIVPFHRPNMVSMPPLAPIDPSLCGDAANDSGTYATHHHVCDLNVLVAGVVGLVSGHVQPNKVNIELSLAPGRPLVHGDPKDVAFAFSGVLGAQLRVLEDADGGDLRLACQLVEWAAAAAPDDAGVRATRKEIYQERVRAETSLMARGVYSWAASESSDD